MGRQEARRLMRVNCFGVFVARQVCLVFEEGDSVFS